MIVIIGTGLAGYTLAREFRKLDAKSPLCLITADDGSYYSKPMLSNALAKHKKADELPLSDSDQMSEELSASILTQTRVATINPEAQQIITETNEIVSYSRLVLATGAQPIPLMLPGYGVEQVLKVNNLEDYRVFRREILGKSSIAVIGPGLIGCEFANDLAASGYQVQVIGPGKTPLDRLLPATVAESLKQALQEEGIVWHLNNTVTRIDRHADQLQLTLAQGQKITVDVVLSAIGLRPEIGLAKSAGLQLNRGIVVDRYLTTSMQNIYALGDCVEIENHILPFVMPIMHGARALAQTLAGKPVRVEYPAMPVTIKTPSFPVVVSPPPQNSHGAWQFEKTQKGQRGLYYGDSDALLGFVLGGDAIKERLALTKKLPGLLD